MLDRSNRVRVAAFGVLALVVGGCQADRILGVEAGTGSQTITLSVGEYVDIKQYGGTNGVYEAPPIISSPAVSFVEVQRDGPPTASQPIQRYRFRFKAVSRGTAVLNFVMISNAPTISDTIIVK